MLFLPFSLGFGALARSHGVYLAGWIIVGASAALATLLIVSTRAVHATPAEIEALEALAATAGDETLSDSPRPLLTPSPDDLACRDLVRLVSDYLDAARLASQHRRSPERLRRLHLLPGADPPDRRPARTDRRAPAPHTRQSARHRRATRHRPRSPPMTRLPHEDVSGGFAKRNGRLMMRTRDSPLSALLADCDWRSGSTSERTICAQPCRPL
jgi:hypothetical protein